MATNKTVNAVERDRATKNLVNLRRTIKTVIEVLPRNIEPRVTESIKRIEMDIQNLEKKVNLHVGDLPQGVAGITDTAVKAASDLHDGILDDRIPNAVREVEKLRKYIIDIQNIVEH